MLIFIFNLKKMKDLLNLYKIKMLLGKLLKMIDLLNLLSKIIKMLLMMVRILVVGMGKNIDNLNNKKVIIIIGYKGLMDNNNKINKGNKVDMGVLMNNKSNSRNNLKKWFLLLSKIKINNKNKLNRIRIIGN